MSRFSRVTQKIFGSGAGPSQIAQFGSLFAGAPAFTTSVATAQSLSNWLTGWFGAAIGGNAPAIEDMNAVMYVLTSQIAYLMQSGIPEWDSGTTYYTGQTVSDSSGLQYVSIVDSNLNHAVSDTTKWIKVGGRSMSLLGDLLFGTTGGNLAVLPGNITTTPMILAQTGTGSVSAAPSWISLNGLATSPTVQVLTASSGTYTKPNGVKWLRVRMVGGGGGGGGSDNSSASGSAVGSAGADTTFGTATAHGGSGGGLAGIAYPGGAGGAASLGSGMAGVALVGGGGGSGQSISSTSTGTWITSGLGGSSPFGGAGQGTGVGTGYAGASGTGSGGGGAGASAHVSSSGGGGGSGGYIDAIIAAPAGTYAFGVGDGGPGGAGPAASGGKGGSGTIIVEEFYQ